MPTSASPDQKANRRRRFGFVLFLLLSTTAMGWLGFGPHRRVPTQFIEEAARRGLLIEGGSRETGALSTTLHNVKAALRTNPRFMVEIGRLGIRHVPFMTPRVSMEGVNIHLQGDPVVHLQTLAGDWPSPLARIEIPPVNMTYTHRLLGELHLRGVVLKRRGDSLDVEAAQAQLGDSAWQDVRLSFEQRKGAAVVRLGGAAAQGVAELTCFRSEGGMSRWLLDLPHGPARPWLERLGLNPGDDFAATRVAGSISVDIPDDGAQPIRGRVQMVGDDWPMFAPPDSESLLGRSFSLLSNVVASTDGSHWELPRAVLTMPVFSLVGKGSLQLGQGKRLALDLEGERACRQLRGLLPPSRALDEVRRFLETTVSGKTQDESARLGVAWDIASPKGRFRPTWHFVPGCGLAPWPQAQVR